MIIIRQNALTLKLLQSCASADHRKQLRSELLAVVAGEMVVGVLHIRVEPVTLEVVDEMPDSLALSAQTGLSGDDFERVPVAAGAEDLAVAAVLQASAGALGVAKVAVVDNLDRLVVHDRDCLSNYIVGHVVLLVDRFSDLQLGELQLTAGAARARREVTVDVAG